MIITDFQQNPCHAKNWTPNGRVVADTEREEAAAEMYLNWMYRLVSDSGPVFNQTVQLDGFLNKQWRGSIDTISCFPNGCDDQGRNTGDVRDNWTSCAMAVLFNQYNLWPTDFDGIVLTNNGDGSQQIGSLGCRYIPSEQAVRLSN